MLKAGDVFLDEFEIHSVLGEGGFATVYHARQRRLGRDVAIKLLHIDDEEARQRFVLEAKLIARLRDPATVTVHDFGEADGQQYMVLEYVEGITLREVIDRDGPLGPHRTVSVLEQVVSALVEAHDRGILHRDIKPENIMLFDHYGQTDRVKVLDFGVAKLLSSAVKVGDAGPMTESGKTIGTPRYMSPEMLFDGAVSDASDIFSLGLVTYEMLTGERAVKSTNGLRVVARILDANPILIPPGTPLPAELVKLVNSMLVKKQEQRLGTAAAVAEAIRRLPVFAPKTNVVGPVELARLRDDVRASEEVDDLAATVSDVAIAPPAGDTQRLEVERFEPKTNLVTPADVDGAVDQLKADAAARMLGDASRAPSRVPPAAVELSLSDRPKSPVYDREEPTPAAPRIKRPLPNRRQLLGYGVLVIAILLTIGFFLGVVGVKTTISEGHPLECGFSSSSIVIERDFEILGARLFEVGREVRCSEVR